MADEGRGKKALRRNSREEDGRKGKRWGKEAARERMRSVRSSGERGCGTSEKRRGEMVGKRWRLQA